MSNAISSFTSSDTRVSLLLRLRDRSDAAAWREFAAIYQPVVWRLARHQGLQPADADDLSQQVLSSLAVAIDRWEHDPQRGRFRTWLHQIVRNAILNALTRRRPDRGAGDTSVVELLAAQVARPAIDPALVELEYRREVFVHAARTIRDEFQEESWQAFWRTAVEGEDPADVARNLNKGVGAVYAAKGRVMRRLREVVAQWEIDDENSHDDL